ncbi:hypothetical protein [Robertkochia aurantiaca]|uniref:hypothetical protein n=1 Tax=Robertkochia aurantiaca TaxID=2873700 RepID=UPI001CC98185|nr:hypothetical protein [Robertkochia sp. 3YJGBD-33]
MRIFSQIISLLFNPLFIPLAGGVAYYLITPKYNPPENRHTVLLALLIVTVIIPLLFYFLLKNLRWITSAGLPSVGERKIPLFIYIILNYIAIMKIIPGSYSPELYYFFVGVIGALVTCLILIYLNFKASMHMMGITGLATFVLGLAVHYEINITLGIAVLVASVGAVATARLYLRSHNTSEVVTGMLIGLMTQLFTFGYWL